MSDPQKKLKGQVDKLRVDPLLAPTYKPVLISDSKGFNLKSQVRVNPETFIEFWSVPSVTSEGCLTYSKANLREQLQKFQRICLLVWVRTCDLTTKSGQIIDVTSHDSSAAYVLIENLRKIYHFVRDFGDGVKLVFLHIPIYSIYEHNKAKGRDWENYKAKDVILHKQIQIVNNYIDDINRILNIQYTPNFSADLQKSKKKTPFSRVKYSYNFSAYSDGVHPGSILAKLWLTRLCKLVHDLCY